MNMTFAQFRSIVRAKGWSIAEVRGDVVPPQEYLELLVAVGNRAERYALRYCDEVYPPMTQDEAAAVVARLGCTRDVAVFVLHDRRYWMNPDTGALFATVK